MDRGPIGVLLSIFSFLPRLHLPVLFCELSFDVQGYIYFSLLSELVVPRAIGVLQASASIELALFGRFFRD